MTDDTVAGLLARIRARLDTDDRVALAASGAWGAQTTTGEHWRWSCDHCDTVITIDPVSVLDTFVQCPNCESYGLGLRSVEHYRASPYSDNSMLPHMVVSTEELAPADAMHLTRHDPARVLREVAAMRAALDVIEHGQTTNWGKSAAVLRDVLHALAKANGDDHGR